MRKVFVFCSVLTVFGLLMPLTVRAAPVTNDTTQAVPPLGTATLVGRVVYPDGRRAAKVPVRAFMQRKVWWALSKTYDLDKRHFSAAAWRSRVKQIAGIWGKRVVTDSYGTYKITGLTTAPYNLVIGNVKSALQHSEGVWVAPAVEGTWAKEGRTVRRLRPTVLTHGGTIEVTLRDKATGVPLTGIRVGYTGTQFPASADGALSAASDRNGLAHLRVPAGVYSIYIMGPWNERYANNVRFVDTGLRAAVSTIQADKGVYAGSGAFTMEVGGKSFDMNLEGNKEIAWTVRDGETRKFTLKLRRLKLAPRPRFGM